MRLTDDHFDGVFAVVMLASAVGLLVSLVVIVRGFM